MADLPTRTSSNTKKEHLADHNELANFHNTTMNTLAQTALAADLTTEVAARKSAVAALSGTYVAFAQLALLLDAIITGTITRDANGAATGAPVIWPDGTSGTYTATTVSTAFPGAVDAYTVTYGSPVTRTYTQPAVTRDANGAVITRPTMVVT